MSRSIRGEDVVMSWIDEWQGPPFLAFPDRLGLRCVGAPWNPVVCFDEATVLVGGSQFCAQCAVSVVVTSPRRPLLTPTEVEVLLHAIARGWSGGAA